MQAPDASQEIGISAQGGRSMKYRHCRVIYSLFSHHHVSGSSHQQTNVNGVAMFVLSDIPTCRSTDGFVVKILNQEYSGLLQRCQMDVYSRDSAAAVDVDMRSPPPPAHCTAGGHSNCLSGNFKPTSPTATATTASTPNSSTLWSLFSPAKIDE